MKLSKYNLQIISHELHSILVANKYNGPFVYDIKVRKNHVNLYVYRPDLLKTYKSHLYNNLPYNLGDYLGYIVVDYLVKKNNIRGGVDKIINSTKMMSSIGSSLIGGEKYGRYDDSTIWGTGVVWNPDKIHRVLQLLSRRKLDIRAVRGPLTRDVMISLGHKCPEVYGDPAILMPMIYMPNCCEKKHKYIVIPQFYHEHDFREKHPDEYCISMNTDNYKEVINEIVSSEIVYTSSLHGIILAEAYGVPVVFFRGLSKKIDFKYLDYYYSTGRHDIKIAKSFEEALAMEPQPLPDLTVLKQGLLDSFPYDLWD